MPSATSIDHEFAALAGSGGCGDITSALSGVSSTKPKSTSSSNPAADAAKLARFRSKPNAITVTEVLQIPKLTKCQRQ